MADKLCECGCEQPTSVAKKTDRLYGHVKGLPIRFINGHSRRKKPGQSTKGTPEYLAFYNAKARCTNPKASEWKHYGGRGIEFRFTSFEQFLAEIGPRPPGLSLDRKENNGHYEPGNVRWATRSEQIKNSRVCLALESFSDEALLKECQRRGLSIH